MIPFYRGAFNDLSPLRVQKLGPEPGDEPLHQSHPVEGGHEVEAVGVGQGLPSHLHRHLKAQRLALLPVEARKALDDVLLHKMCIRDRSWG